MMGLADRSFDRLPPRMCPTCTRAYEDPRAKPEVAQGGRHVVTGNVVVTSMHYIVCSVRWRRVVNRATQEEAWGLLEK